MCGRFIQYSDPEVYASQFELDAVCAATPRYNLALAARIVDVAIREEVQAVDMIQVKPNIEPGNPNDFITLWPITVSLKGDMAAVKKMLDLLTDPSNPVPLETTKLSQARARGAVVLVVAHDDLLANKHINQDDLIVVIRRWLSRRAATGARVAFLEQRRAAERFVEDLSNWYVRRSRRRFWKGDSDADKNAAYSTLYEALTVLAKLLAPTMPFLAEELYQNLVRSFDAPVPTDE